MALKEVRKEKGFTQAYLAEKLGIGQSSYSRLENGISELGANQLKVLRKELDCTADELIEEDEEQEEK